MLLAQRASPVLRVYHEKIETVTHLDSCCPPGITSCASLFRVTSYKMSNVVPNSVSNEVLNEVPNSVPFRAKSHAQFSKLIHPLWRYVCEGDFYHRSSRARREDISVKEVIADEPFAGFFTFVDDVLSKPSFSSYITVELVTALKDLQCVYDEAFLVHGEHSSKTPTDEWVSKFLSSTETFRTIYTFMGQPPIEPSGGALKHLCRQLSLLLWGNHSKVLEEYQRSRAEVERPALLQTICKKLDTPYTDDLYREYREWYATIKQVEELYGNRYGWCGVLYKKWGSGSRYETMHYFVANRDSPDFMTVAVATEILNARI